MDPFFCQEEEDDFDQILNCILSSPLPSSPPAAVAFVRFSGAQEGGFAHEGSRQPSFASRNTHRRVPRFLGRMSAPTSGGEEGSSRGLRHMMREKQRRERMSQGYADLLSMLPYKSKADKNSIVRSAAAYLAEMKRTEEKLRRRNTELEAIPAVEKPNWVIKLRVVINSSAIGCLIGVLRSVAVAELKVRSIVSSLSGDDLLVEVAVETEIPVAEVEGAIASALIQEGKKLFPQQSKWCLSCDALNVHSSDNVT